MSSNNPDKYGRSINNYKRLIAEQQQQYLELATEQDFKELFKGVFIMFIKTIILLYNKILVQTPELKFTNTSEKITNLQTVLNSLETDGKILGIDCNDVIIRSYVVYFYTKYRDVTMEWDINKVKSLNVNKVNDIIINTAAKENLTPKSNEYLNIVPEVLMMINKLMEKDILKILFFLNNLNSILDVYLVKKSSFKKI